MISLVKNGRGIYDLDVSKGCASGMALDKNGCYGDCYAARTARRYGIDFSTTVLRHFKNRTHRSKIIREINAADLSFIRIGCSGDPSEDWAHTLTILKQIKGCNKEVVLITKHWKTLTDEQLIELSRYKVCVNTSVSALDERNVSKMLHEYHRVKPFCKSILRVVSCDFNKGNDEGLRLSKIQDELFKFDIIDTVFRPSKNNPLVTAGIIKVKKARFMGSPSLVSKFNRKAFLGKCSACIDKCGVFNDVIRRRPMPVQLNINI